MRLSPAHDPGMTSHLPTSHTIELAACTRKIYDPCLQVSVRRQKLPSLGIAELSIVSTCTQCTFSLYLLRNTGSYCNPKWVLNRLAVINDVVEFSYLRTIYHLRIRLNRCVLFADRFVSAFKTSYNFQGCNDSIFNFCSGVNFFIFYI